MRGLALLLSALTLLAMRSPLDAPWTAPTVALVPVTRFDSALESVRTAELTEVILPSGLADAGIELPGVRLVFDPDPIERVRRTGEIALVPADSVTFAVRTLALDGRFYWREADRRGWPLRVRAAQARPPVTTWSVVAAGEIIFGRGVQERIEDRFKGDAKAAFVNVRDALRAADLAIATLEAPLSGKKNPWCESCMRFIGNESYAPSLGDAGIDAVSLAANHIGDAGTAGVLDTIRALDAAHVAHVGAGKDLAAARASTILTAGGRRIALLGYDAVPPAEYGATKTAAGSNLLADDPAYARLREDVARASRDADVVIVLAHWGIEYEDTPRPSVVAAAHAMVEAGATAVIGDHPHWVQSVERYRGAYIAYGVGNFVFDQMWSDETAQGSLHELWFADDRLVAVRIRPTLIEDYYRPRLLRPDEPAYRAVLQRIWRHSSI